MDHGGQGGSRGAGKAVAWLARDERHVLLSEWSQSAAAYPRGPTPLLPHALASASSMQVALPEVRPGRGLRPRKAPHSLSIYSAFEGVRRFDLLSVIQTVHRSSAFPPPNTLIRHSDVHVCIAFRLHPVCTSASPALLRRCAAHPLFSRDNLAMSTAAGGFPIAYARGPGSVLGRWSRTLACLRHPAARKILVDNVGHGSRPCKQHGDVSFAPTARWN